MTSDPRPTAARLLVDCLAAEGCEWVFSVPGEETMDILEALADETRVRHVTTRHELFADYGAAPSPISGRPAA